TKEWIAKIHAMHLFDNGWEKLRDTIFANQKKLGVIPPDTQLTPWPDGQAALGGAKLPRWDSLSLIQKKLYIRQAEVFAAYAAYTDYEIGRVIQEVQDQGKLDNTIIICICCIMKTGARTRLIRTWRWAGRGRSTRRSSGPSRWRRISAAPGRAWPFPGPAISQMSAASAPNFTTSLISCRPSLRPPASRRQSWSTAFRRSQLKA